MKLRLLKYYCCFFIICFLVKNTFAQSVDLYIYSTDNKAAILKETFSFKQQFADSISCKKYIIQLPSILHAKGYISASIDSLEKEKNIYTAYLFVGEKYVWKNLFIKEQDKPLLNVVGIQSTIFLQKPFNPNTVTQIQEKLLDYFENNGFPFAIIGFDSLLIDNNEVSAQLIINKGILYKMDSIQIIGNAKLQKNFLYHYLSMPIGGVYNIEKLNTVEKKLATLPFIIQTQPLQLTMLGSSFFTQLFIDNKKSNQVDALIGLMPENQQNGGKLLLTVDAKLKLQNAFASGENIELLWQQIQPKSPRLNLQFQYPYIFNSNFGFTFLFDLYKKDTAYLNIQSAVGVDYAPNNHQNIKLLLQSNRTNLLDVDTSSIKFTKQLPDIIDVSINSIVVAWGFNNTNYTFNPRTGNEIVFTTAVGNRKIRKNNTITQLKDINFNYNNLYNNISLNSYQLKLQLNAAHYFGLGKHSTLKTAIQSGLINSPTIFKNEMFRIGGSKILRGFDEENIFTDKYIVGTAEYRYLHGKNAYFCGFTDWGYTYNSLTKNNYTYLGLGAGISFETKQGIFNIMLATGKRNDLSFNLKQSKIHIGFVSIF